MYILPTYQPLSITYYIPLRPVSIPSGDNGLMWGPGNFLFYGPSKLVWG